MPGNSATVSIAIEVDDKGSVKIRQLGEAARKAGDEGARGFETWIREDDGRMVDHARFDEGKITEISVER